MHSLWCNWSRIPALARQRSLSLMPGSSGHGQSPGAHAPTSSSYDSRARLAFQTLLETVREHFEAKLLRICGCMAEKVPLCSSTCFIIDLCWLISKYLPSHGEKDSENCSVINWNAELYLWNCLSYNSWLKYSWIWLFLSFGGLFYNAGFFIFLEKRNIKKKIVGGWTEPFASF